MNPDAAFPDAQTKPTSAAVDKAIGPAAAKLIHRLLATLAKSHPQVMPEWKFSAQVGWHEIPTLKQRRVLYFIPKRGDFRVSLILGGKAIDELRDGPHGPALTKLLETAPRYPEGTMLSFDRRSLDPELVSALIEAKLAH